MLGSIVTQGGGHTVCTSPEQGSACMSVQLACLCRGAVLRLSYGALVQCESLHLGCWQACCECDLHPSV
jgi:hypothetical protein